MSFEDFFKHFTTVTLCMLVNTSIFTFHKTYNEGALKGRWEGRTAGGCVNYKDTFLHNPQVSWDLEVAFKCPKCYERAIGPGVPFPWFKTNEVSIKLFLISMELLSHILSDNKWNYLYPHTLACEYFAVKFSILMIAKVVSMREKSKLNAYCCQYIKVNCR